MNNKIFNNQGFLTPEGKAFVDETFTKDVRKIMATAQGSGDALIISCILKSIVAEEALAQSQSSMPPPEEPTNPPKSWGGLRLVKPTVRGNVISYSEYSKKIGIKNALSSLSELPDLISDN